MTSSIPFFEFGGNGPLIHFAHPNGYTPACFHRMFSPLLAHYRVIGICHRPLWSGSKPDELSDWRMAADDMIRFFEQEGLYDVVGIGHSLGAVATMYAAVKRPDLFRQLVLIEPIFLPPMVLQAMAANPDIIKEVPLIKNTYRRRNRWPSREAAFTHFRAKSAFAKWPDESIRDYVNHALHEDECGDIVLTYSRDWEVRFYTRPPHDVWEVIPTITHPTLAMRGSESDALLPESWREWQRLQPHANFVQMEGAGHMLVMERPEAVAEIILDYLGPAP